MLCSLYLLSRSTSIVKNELSFCKVSSLVEHCLSFSWAIKNVGRYFFAIQCLAFRTQVIVVSLNSIKVNGKTRVCCYPESLA